MRDVEALTEWSGDGIAVFLAGGISGCPDWQRDVISRLAHLDVVLLNPRLAIFPMSDPSAATAQIEWEHRHLRNADAVLFWFPCEALCPIALYELGAWSMTDKPLFVGTHPDYVRRVDVVEQTRLTRAEVHVVASLDELAQNVIEWVQRR